jgi:Flp pilus assembly protein protease CpaA
LLALAVFFVAAFLGALFMLVGLQGRRRSICHAACYGPYHTQRRADSQLRHSHRGTLFPLTEN